MSIDNIEIIDFIGTAEDKNEVILTISDHLDWKYKMEHLLRLQAKINAYLDFIENEEIYDQYPNSKGKKLIIEVVGKYNIPRDEKIREFFEKVEKLLGSLNISLSFKKL